MSQLFVVMAEEKYEKCKREITLTEGPGGPAGPTSPSFPGGP